MTYLWRDIDAQWWQTVKAAARENKMNVRQWLCVAVANALVDQRESVKAGTGALVTKGWSSNDLQN